MIAVAESDEHVDMGDELARHRVVVKVDVGILGQVLAAHHVEKDGYDGVVDLGRWNECDL